MQENPSFITGLVSIELITKFYSIDLDIDTVQKKYFIQEKLTPEEIIRILKDNGFKASYKNFKTLNELKKYPFPAIIVLKDNSYSVVLGVKAEKVLYFNPRDKKVFEIPTKEFENLWEKKAVVLYPKFKITPFYLNLKWLFNEFFKYRSIFSQVILSSVFIQFFCPCNTFISSNYS